MTGEEKLLFAKVEDAVRLCARDSRPKFIGFLDEASAAAAQSCAKNLRANVFTYGGFDDAERVMLGILPDWCEEPEPMFPITPLTAKFSKTVSLAHRDFLGALMGLRIKRETLGDILVESGRAVLFVTDEIAPFLLQELRKVGSTGVTLTEGFDTPLPITHALQEFSATIPSARLDAVVSALCNSSRGNGAELIERGLVSVNAIVCEKATRQINAGDVIKIRGKGKFIIDAAEDRTRKQRIILQYKKYV